MTEIKIITSQSKSTEGMVVLTQVIYAPRSYMILAKKDCCFADSVISQFGDESTKMLTF